jgi:hypothetical protein
MHFHCDEDWIYKRYARRLTDTAVALNIRYKGLTTGSVVGIITTAATTTDITFEQGATVGAAAVGTGVNPGATGVIDLTSYTTLAALMREINVNGDADWEAWPGDYPLDALTNITAGNGTFLVVTDQECQGAHGYALCADSNLPTAEVFPVAVSLCGPSSHVHAHDRMVRHEILKITATITYASGNSYLQIYECDDIDGTKTLIDTLAAGATTVAATFGTGDTPIYFTEGKRLVVQAYNDATAITAPSIEIDARSKVLAAARRPGKFWSGY